MIIGAGGVAYSYKYYYGGNFDDHWYQNYDASAYFVVEPGVEVNLNIVKFLVENKVKKANVEAKDKYKKTPLHSAAEGENLDIVKYLLKEAKANVNAENKNKQTPLHLAAFEGKLDIVKFQMPAFRLLRHVCESH